MTWWQSSLDSGWCLSSVPRQSGGYFRYAQRHVRTVFYCGQMPVVLFDRCCSWTRLLFARCLYACTHRANCAEDADSTAQFWMVVDMPVGVHITGLWSDSGENWGSAVAVLRWSLTS